jgi:hypothetical protein
MIAPRARAMISQAYQGMLFSLRAIDGLCSVAEIRPTTPAGYSYR